MSKTGAQTAVVISCAPGDESWGLFLAVPQHIYTRENIKLSAAEDIPTVNLIAAFVALRNDNVLARIAIYKPEFNAREEALCFGAFECVNDPDIAKLLINAAIDFTIKAGASELIGPMNGSSWENYRFALSWENRPFFSETVHPAYYTDLIVNSGFRVLSKYASHLQTDLNYDRQRIRHILKHTEKEGIIFRNLDVANFENEIEKLYPFITSVFAGNFLYSPITFEDFRDKYRTQKEWLDPRFVLLAEEESGEIAGMLLAFPDLPDKEKETLVVKTLARKKGRKYAGVAHALAAMMMDIAAGNGYRQLIHAFMQQQNASVNVSAHFSGKPYREYAIYVKKADT